MSRKVLPDTKWVSKPLAGEDGEEGAVKILHVIEVDGDEIKAVGRNLHINELLMNYMPIEESDMRLADPFAIPLDVASEHRIIEVEQPKTLLTEQPNSEVFIYQPGVGNNEYLYSGNNVLQAGIVDSYEKTKPKYTEEEESILNLIDLTCKNKPVNTIVTISLQIPLEFDIIKFREGAEMLGLDQENVISAMAIYLQNQLSEEKLKEVLYSSIDEDKIESKYVTVVKKA